jgi:undecaprenyldiphospho-muramoylpentapeptide beta-N-acetylglucosaminyltransferase
VTNPEGPSGPSERESQNGGTFAVIAGGGTAGHVWPGLAVGRALVAAGHRQTSIHFVGSRLGIEAQLVPEAGFGLTLLPGRGIERRLSKTSVAAAWGLTRAVGQGITLVRARRPAAVLALGGYASVPCGMAAALLRIPLVLHEQNAVPGAANRLLARFARAAAVSFPDTGLPRARLTGNPVRPEVLAVDRGRDRKAARQALGLPTDRFVVAVSGGSLGARRINTAVLAAVPKWSARTDLAVYHVVGRRDWPLVAGQPVQPVLGAETGQKRAVSAPRTEVGGALVYRSVEYEAHMELVLAAADLAVCRSGATTVAELAAVGLPSVLVPLPAAPGDHQTANARSLERAGAAVLVADADLDGDRLVAVVEDLLADRGRLESMSANALTCARRDAAERVAALVEEHARRGS